MTQAVFVKKIARSSGVLRLEYTDDPHFQRVDSSQIKGIFWGGSVRITGFKTETLSDFGTEHSPSRPSSRPQKFQVLENENTPTGSDNRLATPRSQQGYRIGQPRIPYGPEFAT